MQSLRHRRGIARSDRELSGQVASVDALRVERAKVVAKKRVDEARHNRELKRIDRRLGVLEANITVYYFKRVADFPKKMAKTIKLASGRVYSRKTKTCKLNVPEAEVVERIIKSGQWKKFLRRPEPNLTALKQDPAFAAIVGVEVSEHDALIISTPHK